MKTLHLVFHPDLANSKVNRLWLDQVKDHALGVVSRDMYAEYPDVHIDVPREQDLLQAHDVIVIQFPFYWYSSTPLLKKWLDDVLTYGFAYGNWC